MTATQRIAAITLDERSVLRRSPEIESERAAAIADLLHENSFAPASGSAGPFELHLAVEENRLLIEIAGADRARETIQLGLAPFRRIVKDYFVVCESYYDAVRRQSLSQIEAIDAGRRALHNEGSALLIKRLTGKVAIDHDTARRLFTLICVLHLRA
ncbi:MAG TPA: UPF0262 family protein [Stellaceae bacterium]|jgi:uncharacterized protein (UPF0262 family)|nr:UPF0262 family protein [Stellaceae bacterium]